MAMYNIYNSYTLEKLINAVHKMYNTTSLNERLFAGKLNNWYQWYLSKDGFDHYAITSLLYIAMMTEKYVRMYEKGFFISFSLVPSKNTGNSKRSQKGH